jgi:hypothetical protein
MCRTRQNAGFGNTTRDEPEEMLMSQGISRTSSTQLARQMQAASAVPQTQQTADAQAQPQIDTGASTSAGESRSAAEAHVVVLSGTGESRQAPQWGGPTMSGTGESRDVFKPGTGESRAPAVQASAVPTKISRSKINGFSKGDAAGSGQSTTSFQDLHKDPFKPIENPPSATEIGGHELTKNAGSSVPQQDQASTGPHPPIVDLGIAGHKPMVITSNGTGQSETSFQDMHRGQFAAEQTQTQARFLDNSGNVAFRPIWNPPGGTELARDAIAQTSKQALTQPPRPDAGTTPDAGRTVPPPPPKPPQPGPISPWRDPQSLPPSPGSRP